MANAHVTAGARKSKLSLPFQKRKTLRADDPVSAKEADFHARSAKRSNKLKKLRTVNDDDKGGKRANPNFQKQSKKRQRL
jgi:hypothetical protein